MRIAEEEREKRGEEEGRSVVIEWSYMLENNFPERNLWGKYNSETYKLTVCR